METIKMFKAEYEALLVTMEATQKHVLGLERTNKLYSDSIEWLTQSKKEIQRKHRIENQAHFEETIALKRRIAELESQLTQTTK